MGRTALEAALRALVDPRLAWAVAPITDDQDLTSEERAFVANAVEKRRFEFAAGRRAAHGALETLGAPRSPLLVGAHRRPVWPDGFIGSLAHDQGFAVAVVARQQDASHIGIDIAEAAGFPKKLRRQVLFTEAENAQDDLSARATFSAKETVFKALYPEVKAYFGFEAVEVTPDLPNGRFETRLRRKLGRFEEGIALQGRLVIIGDILLTYLGLRDHP